MNDMDKNLELLIERRKIEDLRYRYWYAILDKDVEGLLGCFTDDVHLEYGFGIVLDGRRAVESFFNDLISDEELLKQVPRGANGIVEFTGPDRGKGRWMVEAVTIHKGKDEATLASVQYFEEYIKVDGQWKLCKMRNDYLYFEKISISVL